jgi:hypothetical protein
MKTVVQYMGLCAVAVMLTAAPGSAQKVKTTFDKTNDFSHYKRYAIGKNFIITRQPADVQAQIAQVLLDSMNRQLAAKGFIHDEDHPDFRIKYEAGALPGADVGGQPDMLYGQPVGPTFGVVGLNGIPGNVWTYAMAKLFLTVTDTNSGKPVWTGQTQQKVKDVQKALKDVNSMIDDLMAKTLKTFPPRP